MERGSYVAASGGLVQLRKLEVISNNLANVNTAGFKRQYLVNRTQGFEETFAKELEAKDPYARGDHARSAGVSSIETVTDFSAGPVKPTGNAFDVALRNPKDFFAVSTPAGIQYTRSGNFTLNESGAIVTMDGMEVQGDGGPITVKPGRAQITDDGSVTVDGVRVGRLQVVRAEDPSILEPAGGTRFSLKKGAPQPPAVDAAVVPGSLEMANVSVVGTMVEMIVAQRAFDMYTKSAQTIDQLNQVAINQVGRAR